MYQPRIGYGFGMFLVGVYLTTLACNDYGGGGGSGVQQRQAEILLQLQAGSATPAATCSNSSTSRDISANTPITDTTAANGVCYFKYTATTAGEDPSISLSGLSGDADLFVSNPDTTTVLSDPKSCAAWEACSRTSGTSNETVSSASLASINAGQFRTIAVYGDGANVGFTIQVTK